MADDRQATASMLQRSMPRVILCEQLGSPDGLRWVEAPAAALRPGAVRIAVRAAGLNFPDVLMVAGGYQFKPELPFVPGMEACGKIVDLAPDVAGLQRGQRVIAKLRHGAFAEEIVVAAEQVVPAPAALDDAEAATFLAAHGTAWHALAERAALKPGEVLLVHGAGGGTGLAAVEIGKHLGATVIAVASSEAKLAAATAKGADHGLRTGEAPLRDSVKALTGGRGADVVFDPVGGEAFEQSLRCIAWGARLLVIGFTGGVGQAATNLVLIKGASVLGVRAGEAARRDPAAAALRQATLLRLAGTGAIRPHVSHRLPLARCAEAMALLLNREAIGRVALMA
jgi:NADPH2:quinone reductase